MRINLIFLFFLLFSAAYGQNATVQGTVTDMQSDLPVTGVTIKILQSGTATDLDGKYSLSVAPGSYEISFYIVGYEQQTMSINLRAGETRELNVQLNDGSNLLQTATVTAGKFEKPLGEVTVSLEVLKPKLIENTNTTSVDEVLVKIPGLNIIDGQASIRGGAGFSYGAGTRVLVLVDDIPALQPDAGLPNWDDFPVENLAQIEVLKGAASALYGSSAMNGIINIRTGFAKDKPETNFALFSKVWGTPKDADKKWWGNDTSTLVQPLETGFSFCHRRKYQKLDVVLGAYGLFRDSYNRDTYSRYGRVTPNFRYRVNDRLTIGLNSNFNFGRSGSFFIWGGDSTLAYQPGVGSASYTKGRLRFNIDPTLQYFDKNGNRHKILSRYFYIHNNNSGNQSNDSRLYYGEYQFQRQFEKIGLVMTAGAVGTYNTVDAEVYGNAQFTSRNLAGYLQLDYKVFDRLNLSAGARYEHNVQHSPDTIYIDRNTNDFGIIPNGEVAEGKPVFRFGANYRAAEATYFRASWGQGYRYPTIAEKFVSTDFGIGNSVVPNPNLFSETGWTAEIGFKQGFKVSSWQGYFDLTGFVSEYQDMMEFVLDKIAFVPGQGLSARFQSQNTADTRTTGWEVSIVGQGKLGEGSLSMLVGFTSTQPKYKEFNDSLLTNVYKASDSTNVLKYRFRNSFKFDAEYTLKKLSLGASVQYYSHMESIDAVFEYGLPGVHDFRERHNKGFTVVDLRAAYSLNKKARISAICGNLLNQEYTVRPALLEGPRNYTIRFDYKI
ncbi:MAG: TonB-dependent receptor [Saprospiraceae bacterium]|nr:TonB-dependent receptor [Saprospiraceae bacterium]MCB9345474.1 TonB-dependent receptor [Lewinellaceae bacterium]